MVLPGLKSVEVKSSLFRGREAKNRRLEGRMKKVGGCFEMTTKDIQKLKRDLREAGVLGISESIEE